MSFNCAFPSIKMLFSVGLIASSSLMLSGCFESETDKCIDAQSYLWNNAAKSKAQNQAYWNAVQQCKEKYR